MLSLILPTCIPSALSVMAAWPGLHVGDQRAGQAPVGPLSCPVLTLDIDPASFHSRGGSLSSTRSWILSP